MMNNVSDETQKSQEYVEYISCMEKNCSNKIHDLYDEMTKSLSQEISSNKSIPPKIKTKIHALHKEMVKKKDKSFIDKMSVMTKVMKDMATEFVSKNMKKTWNFLFLFNIWSMDLQIQLIVFFF